MKKLTAVIITLLLVLAFIPTAAFAATAPIGGTDNVIVDGRVVAPGEAITLTNGGWASLSVAGDVLTLDNAHVSIYTDTGMISYNKSFTINLQGSNSIIYSGSTEYVTGIMAGGDLTIKGSGSLYIELRPQGNTCATSGIFALGNIKVVDTKVKVSAVGGTVDGILAGGGISFTNASVTSYVTSYGTEGSCPAYAIAARDFSSEGEELGKVVFDGAHVYAASYATSGEAYCVSAGDISMKRTYVDADVQAIKGDAYAISAAEDLNIKISSRLDVDAFTKEGLAAGIYSKGIAEIDDTRINITSKTACNDICDDYCGAFGFMLHYADFDDSKIKITADRSCYCTQGTVGGVSADYLGIKDTAFTVRASASSFMQGNAGMELKQLVIEGNSDVRVYGNMNCDGVLIDYGRGAFTIDSGKLYINAGRLGLVCVNCDVFFNGGVSEIVGGIAAIVGANDGYELTLSFAKRMGIAAPAVNFVYDADGCFTVVRNGSPFAVVYEDGAIKSVTGAVGSIVIAQGYTNIPVVPVT